MIQAKGIYKAFGNNKIINGVDITVEDGKTVALLGSSGAGKSTLLRCINLLEQPDSGMVTIDDYTFSAADTGRKVRKEVRKRTGMVFQNFNLFGNKTALENVTEALKVVKRMPADEADEVGRRYLAKVGMLEKQSCYPSTLSGGQKQRVAIARAIALKPRIVLLDEPTSALDPELVQEVQNVIKKLAEEKTTMLIVTHEMDFAREVADRIVFIDNGQVAEESETEDFFLNPKEERTKQFMKGYYQKFSYSI